MTSRLVNKRGPGPKARCRAASRRPTWPPRSRPRRRTRTS